MRTGPKPRYGGFSRDRAIRSSRARPRNKSSRAPGLRGSASGRRSLRLVLDSNVFILAFTAPRLPDLIRLLTLLAEHPSRFDLVVGRTILTEVEGNLSPQAFNACWG